MHYTTKFLLKCALSFTVMAVIGCSDSDSVTKESDESESDFELNEVSSDIASRPKESELGTVAEVWIGEALPNRFHLIPGTLRMDTKILDGEHISQFAATYRALDNNYREVSREEVLNAFEVPPEASDTVRLALKGIVILKETAENEEAIELKGNLKARVVNGEWELIELVFAESKFAAGALASKELWKTMTLDSPELKDLISRIQKHVASSGNSYQTSQFRESKRLQALKEMQRIRHGTAENSR